MSRRDIWVTMDSQTEVQVCHFCDIKSIWNANIHLNSSLYFFLTHSNGESSENGENKNAQSDMTSSSRDT